MGVAQIHQLSGDMNGASLIGARAVENDLAIRRHLVEPSIHLFKIRHQGTRNEMTGLVSSKCRAQVDDYRALAFNNQPVQLIDGNPRHAQPVVEATSLPPLDRDVSRKK